MLVDGRWMLPIGQETVDYMGVDWLRHLVQRPCYYVPEANADKAVAAARVLLWCLAGDEALP